jgi:tRNA(Ile)-lysidine synthase
MKSLTQAFLNVHWDQSKPLLLGYSGGPDSKALLYALLECGVRPHLAHVDHGWREESSFEAESLRQEAEQLGCPFHTVRLQLKGKGEDEARKGRFAFFQTIGIETLLLAHQADDLAETVLKRVLEGAHLSFLGGMQPVSERYGLAIWRPLLGVRRAEILDYLEERGLKAIIDPSNSDPAYLRARMRLEILPSFGKEVVPNLVLLSERAAELKAYLDRQVAAAKIHRGPWGTLIELEGLERIEQRHLLQKIAREESVVLTRPVLDTLLDWIKEGQKAKHLILKTKKILVDRGRVCFISLVSKDSISDVCR